MWADPADPGPVPLVAPLVAAPRCAEDRATAREHGEGSRGRPRCWRWPRPYWPRHPLLAG